MNFDEHDVAIPIQVLEEIDNFKKGNDTRNFEARGFVRFLDKISDKQMINEWIPLGKNGKGNFKVVFSNDTPKIDAESIFGDGKYDHKVNVGASDEIGELSKSFNEMSKKLENTQKELINKNEQLSKH